MGQLAKQTGLTVRTLHHYDQIGLLSPSSHSEKGYRIYTKADIARLQQIMSLKQLGFSLEEIKEIMEDPNFTPAPKTTPANVGYDRDLLPEKEDIPLAQETQNCWNGAFYDDNLSFVSRLGQGVMELLQPRAGERILDLGCGTGDLTRRIRDAGAHPEGIDRSEEMVREARRKYPDIPFRVADARRFRADALYDAVFSNAALHWIRGLEAALHRRGIDPAGRNPWYFPSIGDYAALLEKRGFRVLQAFHFDRPTPLPGGEEGMENWLAMFGDDFFAGIPPRERAELVREVKEEVRDTLFRDGQWLADYRRIRVLAVKEG